MKEIRIKYLDWWKGFDKNQYLINQIISKYYDVIDSDTPDYVISSVYAKEALKYNCVRIFCTPENFIPDFNIFDYGIGFENIQYGDRYVMAPNYVLNLKYLEDIRLMQQKHLNQPTMKRDFCSYVVSNGVGDIIRTIFFEELCKYKKVNSGGRYQNNIGMPDGIPDKLKFQQKHKFSICFENSAHPGYITEKLVQGFAAGTIPIYWGAPDVTQIYNEKAMIILKDIKDITRAIETIKRIDSDDELYMEMLRQPALKDSKYIEKIYQQLENFLTGIFEQDYCRAYRRPNSATVETYYSNCCDKYQDFKKKKRFCILKGRI